MMTKRDSIVPCISCVVGSKLELRHRSAARGLRYPSSRQRRRPPCPTAKGGGIWFYRLCRLLDELQRRQCGLQVQLGTSSPRVRIEGGTGMRLLLERNDIDGIAQISREQTLFTFGARHNHTGMVMLVLSSKTVDFNLRDHGGTISLL